MYLITLEGLCAFHILFNHRYGAGGGQKFGAGGKGPISFKLSPGARRFLYRRDGLGLGGSERRGEWRLAGTWGTASFSSPRFLSPPAARAPAQRGRNGAGAPAARARRRDELRVQREQKGAVSIACKRSKALRFCVLNQMRIGIYLSVTGGGGLGFN